MQAFLPASPSTFTATGIAEVTDVTHLVLVKRPNAGSPWILDGAAVTGSGTTTAPVISRTGLSGFSEFAIGGDNFTALPVTLLTFSGQKTGPVNRLDWTTASEQHNLGFEVQRSADGVNYTVLGFVNSQARGGNSTARLAYSFVDSDPQGTRQQYRLRQIDLDHQSKYSPVIVIQGEKPKELTIAALFPNPARSVVNMQVSAPVQDQVMITVTDMQGKLVMQQTARLGAGSNSLALNVGGLPGGTYVVTVVSSTHAGTAVARFVRQ